MTARTVESGKSPYHHGNLAAALIDAAFELARDGGPAAITVREAARRVGVSAPAAYRHFEDRDRLVNAVAQRCREELARTMATARDHHRAPVRRFEAVGRAYIDFARAERGLIDTAFVTTGSATDRQDDPDALTVLTGVLDELLAAGLLPPERREGAELIAWSAVHGISMLLNHTMELDGLNAAATNRVLAGVLHALDLAP